MTRAEILEELAVIFHEVFEDPSIVLTEATTANDIAEWDSIHHINLVVAVESNFGLKLRTSEIEKLTNVGDLVTAIGKRSV